MKYAIALCGWRITDSQALPSGPNVNHASQVGVCVVLLTADAEAFPCSRINVFNSRNRACLRIFVSVFHDFSSNFGISQFKLHSGGCCSMIKEDVRLFLVATIINFFSGSEEFRGPHHPHRHYLPQKDGVKLTQDENLLHDAEHIQEDLGDWVTKGSKKLTPEELEFHYFIVHDFDNNTKLDGLEILKAISHTLDHSDEDADRSKPPVQSTTTTEAPITDKEKRLTGHYQGILVGLIDQVLLEDDTDRDGYLSYPEFVIGRQREKKNKVQPPH